jgi:hypothetical protein
MSNKWRPLSTTDEKEIVDRVVLLFCPHRDVTNRKRIEIGWAHTSLGGHHAWATHWMELPGDPDPDEVARILANEVPA